MCFESIFGWYTTTGDLIPKYTIVGTKDTEKGMVNAEDIEGDDIFLPEIVMYGGMYPLNRLQRNRTLTK